MKIDTIKEFTKLIKLCQAHGVTSVEIDGMKLSILPKAKTTHQYPLVDANTPLEASIPVPAYNGTLPAEVAPEAVKSEELTEEQLLMWSATSVEETAEQ